MLLAFVMVGFIYQNAQVQAILILLDRGQVYWSKTLWARRVSVQRSGVDTTQ